MFYNLGMLTPKNITELKTTVRDYFVSKPDYRRSVLIIADVPEDATPDLFAWVRMWAAIQQLNGADEDDVRNAILGTM